METIRLGVGSNGKRLLLKLQKDGVTIDGEVEAIGDSKVLAEIVFTLPSPGRPAFLDAFYVRSPTEKGLGKRMLCAVLTKYSDLLKGQFIELQASGGRCHGTHVATESEAELDAFLAKYPEVVAKLERDAGLEGRLAPSKEEKGIAVCAIRQNPKLIQYYQTYGFEIVEDHGDHADMRAKAEDVLKACTTSGGAKRTTRKTRRRHRIRRKSFPANE
jgi:hypothetical protein